MLTLLGSLFGIVSRLLPEVITAWNKKADQAHEVAMFNMQLEADRLKGDQQIQQIQAQGQVTMDIAGVQALTESIKAQAQPTGIKWVDAINSLVRPVLTFWWVVVLSSVAMVSQILLLTQTGMPAIAAIAQIWGEPEKALVASIFNFWFLDRVIRKQQGV